MKYNENISSGSLLLSASMVATAPASADLVSYGDIIKRAVIWSTAGSTFFRLLNNGKYIAPVSGYIALPNGVPMVLELEYQLEGPPHNLVIEGYNASTGTPTIYINIASTHAKEKDLELQQIQRLDHIIKLLQHAVLKTPINTPPEGF